uniref:C2H2-type domain-containing protein n=1 Tax=Nothobranchius furzeri TaxID=105023 RepID=A0A8C6NL67_NOTFU
METPKTCRTREPRSRVKKHCEGKTRAGLQLLLREEAHEEQSAGVDQKDSEHLHLMRKQEGLWTSLEEEQLCLKEETDPVSFPFTVVFIKGEDDEENPLLSELHHQEQMENEDVQTTSSADHMTSETSAGAQTNRNPDLKPHEQTSSSSEAEVNGEEEVNLDSELSDSGPEIGDGDSDWNENRSSESGVKIINKSFSCPECGKQFFHKSSLQKHMRVTEPKSFSCDDCGKMFSHKTGLNTHMSVHTGQKPFTCQHCGQQFRQKAYLNSHMRVHTKQKPFTCEFCGRRFSHKASLNSHIRVHTGQKPFACELCGQKFSQNAHLNCHKRVHTGQKPLVSEES